MVTFVEMPNNPSSIVNSEPIVTHSLQKCDKCKSDGRKNEVTQITLKYTQNKLLYLVFHIWKGYEK